MIVKGQKINNRYEILKNIGEGGMANVYLAQDIILNRLVAIKVLRGDLATDEKFVRRFQREALSASSLSHPNIVEMYDVGEDEGNYYIVMEFVQGKTLKQLIKKRGKLTVPEVVDIMLQITDAMSLAHDSLIIHRDLKPQNIMIGEDGGIKITDFGIAMALNGTQLTQTNSVMGSVHYLPPEQANGKGATLKSDIYSLGIMMYELLTGKLPFRGENAVEIALKHLKEEIPSAKTEDPTIPQSVDNIVRQAAAKNSKNRYNNAKEMYEDLKTCLNKERLNEPIRMLKYNDVSEDDPKAIELSGDIDNSLVKHVTDDSDKKNNSKVILLFAIFGVLALVLAGIFFIYPLLTESKEGIIPDVKGLTVAQAEKKLKDEGFTVAVDTIEIADSEIEAGLIVKTAPAAGRTIKKSKEITLYVSTGMVKYVVEDLIGKNYIEVQTYLESVYGIEVIIEEKKVEVVEGEEAKEYDAQEIIGQSVDPETILKKGDAITLYIPKDVNKYPDFVKDEWTVEEVQTFADKYQIILTISYLETSDYEPGTIISQSRVAKSEILSNTTLKIVVAKAPQALEEEIDITTTVPAGG